jgi:sarcosine oxidase subunit alpha
MLERRQPFVERMLEDRDHEQAIEAPDAQRVQRGEYVRNVRGVETSAVNSDNWHRRSLWINFAALSMPTRRSPLEKPVEIRHDGEPIEARSGESLAHALLAADRVVLTRSPKLHRPRGPYCLRAACEGCLMRVNGVPNVMACRHRVRGGERVETQNVVGSRKLDLLAATDFLFPHGLDHHRLFAGVRGVSNVVGALARRIAGLGRLPDAPREPRPSELGEVPVLVVGGGRAGLTLARELGERATLVDDGLDLGGALGLLEPEKAAELEAAARANGATLLARTTAAGIYPGPEGRSGRASVLLGREGSAQVVLARAIVLATGEHDPTPDFPGNDLPGTLSARAGLALLRGGIVPDVRTVVVGEGRFAERVAAELGPHLVERIETRALARAEGRLRLKSVTVRAGDGERRLPAGALLYDGPASPAFELAVQAGVTLDFAPERGYVPVLHAEGRAAPNVWCTGSMTGTSEDSAAGAERLARRILETIRA